MSGLSSLHVGWLNRASEYYFAARLLYGIPLFGPAAFCGYHAVELMMKLALVQHDRSFNPRGTGHAISKMVRMVNNKARPDPRLSVPAYFYHEQRFLSVARYPRQGLGVLIPASFLDDLDRVFAELVRIIPIPGNTRFAAAVRSPSSSLGRILAMDNESIGILRQCVQT